MWTILVMIQNKHSCLFYKAVLRLAHWILGGQMFKLLISPFISYRCLKYNLLQNLELLRNLSGLVDTGVQMHVFHNIRAFVWQGMFQEMAVNCLLLGVLVLIPQFWFQLELMIRYGSLVSLAQHKSQQLTKGMTSFLFLAACSVPLVLQTSALWTEWRDSLN